MLQTAIVAQRTAEEKPDTEEIRGLTEAAGARILGEVTQQRPPDPGTELGPGKVDEIADMVEATGADTVVVDAELTPQQTVTLEDTVGAHVVDRHRVVLEIFAEQARTRRAQLQVELARLRYRLPRVRALSDEGALNRFTESGTPYYDLLDRIDELERKLDDLPSVAQQHREQRRENGFELVALAGYTNAGKSTLLRRLAEEMELDPERHEDLDETATVEDRLFKTLETTTRRATLNGRSALLTDTVGFLDDLPHWLVESFRNTLTAVEEADTVVVVADLAQSADELRRKLETVHDALGDDHPPVVTVLNKADLVSEAKRTERAKAIADLAPDPVVISAEEDTDLNGLTTQICKQLPTLAHTELTLPLTDEAMSLLSWLHDEAVDVEVTYGTDRATVEVAARPPTLERARSRLEELPA
ncbi:HflX GTPase family protein [Halovenus rubra]|uniref:HflX GTPase family protein n=2 Tax=Halovenus rubra TaxID=869890 RepID=A0ACC7E5L4_9EURY|nr:GTPase HflX [Halovenus rubra]